MTFTLDFLFIFNGHHALLIHSRGHFLPVSHFQWPLITYFQRLPEWPLNQMVTNFDGHLICYTNFHGHSLLTYFHGHILKGHGSLLPIFNDHSNKNLQEEHSSVLIEQSPKSLVVIRATRGKDESLHQLRKSIRPKKLTLSKE